MVSVEEALKFMEERVNKGKKHKPKVPASSPLASPSRNAKKRKHVESSSRPTSLRPTKGSHKCKMIMGSTEEVEKLTVIFPLRPSIFLYTGSFSQFILQLVFQDDTTHFKEFSKAGTDEQVAHLAFELPLVA